MDDLARLTIWLPTLMLVILRIAGICLVAPVLNETAVPRKLRVFMSIAISVGVVGRVTSPVSLPSNAIDLIVGLGGEVLLGVTIGYTARVIFAGVELGAFHIGQQMGVGLGEVLDPFGGEASGAVRRLFHILAVVIFLAIGGHRMLISGLLGTFKAVPLMSFTPGGELLEVITGVLKASFVLGLKVAAPVLLALLLGTVALGMLQKTIPQCNTLSTGLPIRAALGLFVLGAGLWVLPVLIEVSWTGASKKLSALFEVLG